MVKYFAIFMASLLIGCASPDINRVDLPKMSFTKSEKFVYEEITKPAKPAKILLGADFQPTEDAPVYIAFSAGEFAKIVALSKAFDYQEQIIRENINLLNLKTKENNSLKDIISIKENLLDHINILYINEQEMRMFEQKNYKLERIANKIYMIIQSGVIIAIAFLI